MMSFLGIFKKKISSAETECEPVSRPTPKASANVYDFDSLEGIQHIKMPDHPVDMYESPEYKLQLEASRHFDEGNDELAFACLRKSNELMPFSKICEYPAKTYCRLVRQLKLHDRFEEAYEEESKLRKEHPEFFDGGKIYSLKAFQETLKLSKEFGTDLVEMSAHEGSCGECAKYQGRVYSISGHDKEFPPLPQIVFEQGCIHPGCSHQFHPYIRGSKATFETTKTDYCSIDDIVSFSNRPFVDDRSEKDILRHDERMQKSSDYLTELLGDDEKIRANIARKKEYALICEALPNLAPKSYSGYSRMKNGNTKNYQKIKEELQKLGFDI